MFSWTYLKETNIKKRKSNTQPLSEGTALFCYIAAMQRKKMQILFTY
ncbi:hypothetical protein [Aquimarina hainanensis]